MRTVVVPKEGISRVERCARLRETRACAAVFRGNPRNCAITRKIALFRSLVPRPSASSAPCALRVIIKCGGGKNGAWKNLSRDPRHRRARRHKVHGCFYAAN